MSKIYAFASAKIQVMTSYVRNSSDFTIFAAIVLNTLSFIPVPIS